MLPATSRMAEAKGSRPCTLFTFAAKAPRAHKTRAAVEASLPWRKRASRAHCTTKAVSGRRSRCLPSLQGATLHINTRASSTTARLSGKRRVQRAATSMWRARELMVASVGAIREEVTRSKRMHAWTQWMTTLWSGPGSVSRSRSWVTAVVNMCTVGSGVIMRSKVPLLRVTTSKHATRMAEEPWVHSSEGMVSEKAAAAALVTCVVQLCCMTWHACNTTAGSPPNWSSMAAVRSPLLTPISVQEQGLRPHMYHLFRSGPMAMPTKCGHPDFISHWGQSTAVLRSTARGSRCATACVVSCGQIVQDWVCLYF